MQEKIMAIVKYKETDFAWYGRSLAEMQAINPGYEHTAVNVPTAFLYCEPQYANVLTGDLVVGGTVTQTVKYNAVDSIDNQFYGKTGIIMALGYESFILDLLNQEYPFMETTTVYQVEF